MARDTQKESLVARFRQGLLQFIPCGFELCLRALVFESVEPDVFNKDIKAVNKGRSRGTAACLRCAGDRDKPLP